MKVLNLLILIVLVLIYISFSTTKADDMIMYLSKFAKDKDFIEICLEDYDLSYKNELGRTILHKVAKKGDKELFNVLIENGADKDHKDIFGKTAGFYLKEFKH